jgi:hypothetical protein
MQKEKEHNTMKTNEEQTQTQAVPVMKQLARPMSAEELAMVSGSGPGTLPCGANPGYETDNLD